MIIEIGKATRETRGTMPAGTPGQQPVTDPVLSGKPFIGPASGEV